MAQDIVAILAQGILLYFGGEFKIMLLFKQFQKQQLLDFEQFQKKQYLQCFPNLYVVYLGAYHRVFAPIQI